MISVYDYLKPALPRDHARQSRATDLVRWRLAHGFSPKLILDLGCGSGSSIDFFRKVAPSVEWIGVDIEESPEVNARQREDATFFTFDGLNLPFESSYFDIVYSNQVLEHVRHPEVLLSEVRRVLSCNGLFIGQTSHLEPYHSFSYWSYTPFGFKKICEDAGLSLLEMRPGIDGLTLCERSYRGRPPEYSQWFSQESPRNLEIDEAAKRERLSNQVTNFRKLMYCGQFCFVCAASGSGHVAVSG